MSRREEYEKRAEELLAPIVELNGFELVDVEYVRERDWYLRVYLDKLGGIDLDDCQLVSEQLSSKLDEKDPISDNYLLEVSSPGLDRALKKDKDFIRYNGRDVDIQCFKPVHGSKQYTGALQGFTDDTVDILINDEVVTFERSTIAQIRLHLDF